jgi:hypothetical protein
MRASLQMSAAADCKSTADTVAVGKPEQKMRADMITAAVGSALLPELISLAADYLTAGLRFDPQRTSKYLTITVHDDPVAWRRVLLYEDPTERPEPERWDGFYSTLTDTPLGVIGGPKGRVMWRVEHGGGRPRLCAGVASADTLVVSDNVDVSRVFALLVNEFEQDGGDSPVYARLAAPNGRFEWHNTGARSMPTVTITADLATDTLHFSAVRTHEDRAQGVELLPETSRTLRVPQLAIMHAFVAVGYEATVELMDG